MTESNSNISKTGSFIKRSVCAFLAAAVMAANVPSVMSYADEYSAADELVSAEAVSSQVVIPIVKTNTESECTITSNSVKFAWNPVANAERFQIYIKGGKYDTWTKYKTVFADTTSYTAKNLESGTEYQFKVRGIATGVKGYFSKTLKVTTLDAAAVTIPKVKMKSEAKYGNDSTHPFGKQTSCITVNWNPVSGAERYQIYIKGGKYGSWTKYKTVFADTTSYTVKKLERNTEYQFKVRGIATGVKGDFSSVQKISTARMDFDWAGWQAMCRIVYHEVGQINDSMWDEPIVHVADCVVNQYEAAKYLNDSLWAPYYKRYSSIQSIIYTSGGFMSDSALARDGATYAKCTSKVKLAVYGAVYDKVTVNDIKHDKKVFYWCNTGYKPTGKKVSYVYKIPWGYFNIWNEYWG